MKEELKFEKNFSIEFKLPLILSTGGYNDAYLQQVSSLLKADVLKCREYLRFVIKAIDFLNKKTNDAMFKLQGPVNTKLNQAGKIDPSLKPKQHYFSLGKEIYPYLLVNLRSGASFIRVDGPDNYKRVGGTSIGVGFAWGVSRYMGLFNNPTEMCDAARKGDSSKIDMSVGDIYGGEYKGLGFPSDMIASSFGKLKDEDDFTQISNDDIARSLLTLIAANNLIYSKILAQVEGIKRVIWIGTHLDHLEYMQLSEYQFATMTNNEQELMFPTYHSFLGSLGLLLCAADSCME